MTSREEKTDPTGPSRTLSSVTFFQLHCFSLPLLTLVTQLESPIDESGPAEREEREAALGLPPLLHVWGGSDSVYSVKR